MKLRDLIEATLMIASVFVIPLVAVVAAVVIICAPFAVIGFVIYKCLELFR